MSRERSADRPTDGERASRSPGGSTERWHRLDAALAPGRPLANSLRRVTDLATPWIEILVRVWLARVFIESAALRIMTDTPPVVAMKLMGADQLDALIASLAGLAIQIACPILLAVGIAARPAALALLVQTLLLTEPSRVLQFQLMEAALLGWLVVRGAGPISFDAVLGHGLDTSALPGAARLARAYGWIGRYCDPAYRLLVRICAATVILAGGAVAPSMPGEWMGGLPSMIAPLPPTTAWAVAIALSLGLGTRLVALALLLLVPFDAIASIADPRLAWGFLLGLLGAAGPGPYSLDRVLVDIAAAIERAARGAAADMPHVVIVGGGFGGVAAARALQGAPCRITLVDARNHHLFQPLLYQVATAGLSPSDIATPIRSLFREQANVSIRLAELTGIDTGTREIALGSERLTYDHLVLATGSRHSYFGRDAWAGLAPGLKQIEDATDIRRRLLVAFERAEAAASEDAQRAWLTFVVVGGGPTGVELAGAIAELARHSLAREFRRIDPGAARVVLVQAGERLLPAFPPSLSADALSALTDLGVEVRLATNVEEVDAQGVVLAGESLPARTVLWAAGVAASPLGPWLARATDPAGRVLVDADLSVPGHREIFVVGDTAASLGWNGRPVPGLAPAAKQGGRYAGRVIRARLTGRAPPTSFRYRHAGSLATIGRQAAVAEFGRLRLRGALAWWVWGFVHVLFLASGRNRATVVLGWVWAYLTYRRGTRLITGDRAAD